MNITPFVDFNPLGFPVPIDTSDTIVISRQTANRYSVSACSIFNGGPSTVTVDVFVSVDTSSAAGSATQIDTITIIANERVDVDALINQSYSGSRNVIMVADLAGCVVDSTGHEYTGA